MGALSAWCLRPRAPTSGNLLLARGAGRRRADRRSAWRSARAASGLLRQLLAGSLLLAVAGAGARYRSSRGGAAICCCPLRPFGAIRRSCSICRSTARVLAATAGVVGRLRPGVRACCRRCRRAASTSRRQFQGGARTLGSRRPVVGRARPARRAGGALAGAAGQRRPVRRGTLRAISMPSTPASTSAACCCSASTRRRPATPPIAVVALHDRDPRAARRDAGRSRRHLLQGPRSVANPAEQVVQLPGQRDQPGSATPSAPTCGRPTFSRRWPCRSLRGRGFGEAD